MSSPMLSMNHQDNWYHSKKLPSSSTAMTTSKPINNGNVSFNGQSSLSSTTSSSSSSSSRFDFNDGKFALPSTIFDRSTNNISSSTATIFFQKIGCSMSLPILYSKKMTPSKTTNRIEYINQINDNNNYIDNCSTNKNSNNYNNNNNINNLSKCKSFIVSSLPNLKFFDKKFQEITERLDSIDTIYKDNDYKNKNKFDDQIINSNDNDSTITTIMTKQDQQQPQEINNNNINEKNNKVKNDENNENNNNNNDSTDDDEQDNKNNRVDSLDIYKRRRSSSISSELDLAIAAEKFPSRSSNENIIQSILPPQTPSIIDDLARLKIELTQQQQQEQQKDNENSTPDQSTITTTATTTKSTNNQQSTTVIDRKNSSMIPILPNLELLSKLCDDGKNNDNDDRNNLNNENDHRNDDNVIQNDDNQIMNQLQINDNDNHIIAKTSLSTVDNNNYINDNDSNNNVEINGDNIRSNEMEKTPHLNQYKSMMFIKSGLNKEQESAAAWLAAATQQLTEKILNHKQIAVDDDSNQVPDEDLSINNVLNNQNNEITNDSQNNQNNNCNNNKNRRKKRSILRTKSLSIHYEKKNVRFADTIGKALENVHYFMLQSPQTPPRRYSSYTPPVNNEWNSDSWHNVDYVKLKNNNDSNKRTMTSATASLLPLSMKRDYLNNTINLNPRYELEASNFKIQSLLDNFIERLYNNKILLHSLQLAETTVYGNVSVVNLHFVKKVFVRYTFNDWSTFIEREATYMLGSHDGNTDKFSFVIYARPQDFGLNHNYCHYSPFYQHHQQQKTSNTNDDKQENHQSTLSSKSVAKMYFAIRFQTGDGQEFWDNNNGENYRLDLKPF